MKIFDVIIIGSGPAGMTAGIYCARRTLKTLIISKDVGGQMSETLIIENYPGFKKIEGVNLSFQIKDQVEALGVEFELSLASKIIKKNNLFEITTDENKIFQAKSIILAFGLEKRKLGVKKEKKFDGKGLSYCINCDGPLFKNKTVAVVGGGNAGAEAVEFLAKICTKIYWLEINKKIIADEIILNKINKFKNVEISLNTEVKELIGDQKIESIKINQKNKTKKISVEGIFVEIGIKPKINWLNNIVELDEQKQIKVNEFCHSNTPGIFSAGDITNTKYKQIVVAQGQGAIAALEAYNYININK